MTGWDELDVESRELRAPERFESRMVERVMRKLGLSGSLPAMVEQCREATGSDVLSFDWFHDQYPAFPIRLGAKRVPWLHKVITMEHLVKRFTRTPVFRGYQEFLEERGVNHLDESAGLVFGWPDATTVVVHNYLLDIDPDVLTSRIILYQRMLGTMRPPMLCTIETLDGLLDAIRVLGIFSE
jgi:hypothetical protein